MHHPGGVFWSRELRHDKQKPEQATSNPKSHGAIEDKKQTHTSQIERK